MRYSEEFMGNIYLKLIILLSTTVLGCQSIDKDVKRLPDGYGYNYDNGYRPVFINKPEKQVNVSLERSNLIHNNLSQNDDGSIGSPRNLAMRFLANRSDFKTCPVLGLDNTAFTRGYTSITTSTLVPKKMPELAGKDLMIFNLSPNTKAKMHTKYKIILTYKRDAFVDEFTNKILQDYGLNCEVCSNEENVSLGFMLPVSGKMNSVFILESQTENSVTFASNNDKVTFVHSYESCPK